MLFAGLGSTIKSATSLLVLFYPPSFLLSQTLWLIWQELSSLSFCSIRLQWSPDTHFTQGTMRLMSWPDGERYLRPLQSLVVSFLLSLVSTLFSDWRHTVSSKFFDTQVTSIFIDELVLPHHARCVLSCLCCNRHSLLLGSYLSRIGRIENRSCSTCGHSSQDTSHFILHCPATDSLRHSFFGTSLSLYNLWSRPWGVVQLLGLHGLLPCPHHLEGVG